MFVVLGLILGVSVLAGGAHLLAGLTEATGQTVLAFAYRNVEWMGPLLIVVGVLLIFAWDRWGNREPFSGVPWGAPWWQNIVFGASTTIYGVAFAGSMFGGVILTGAVLPFKIASEYILSPSSTVTKLIVATPLAFSSLGVILTVAMLMTIGGGRGGLIGDEGRLAESPPRGTGAGSSDVVRVYYFVCLALLGVGFGEYKPVGYCRLISLIAVVVGRILEIVVIAVGINLLANRLGH